jgi:hypothetical protein
MAVLLLLSCGKPESADLVFRHPTIVDVKTGELKSDQMVVVRDGVMTDILSAAHSSAYDAATVVEAAGGFEVSRALCCPMLSALRTRSWQATSPQRVRLSMQRRRTSATTP